MLSSEDAKLKGVDFPTLRRKRLRTGNNKTSYVVPDLAQKIVKISDNVFIGWAGPLCCAVDVINFLINKLGGRISTQDEMITLCDDINQWKNPKLELSAIGSYGSGWQPFMGSGGLVSHPHLGQIHVLGSGTQQFINHLLKDRFVPITDDACLAPYNADTIHYALSFMLKSMSRQREFDYGLDKRWGSALEILVLRNGLEKVGNILYQSYRYKRGRSPPSIKLFSNRIFMFYHGEDLVVETYSPNDGLLEYVIPPPQKLVLGLPSTIITNRPSSPQLTVTTLIDVDDWTKSRTFVEWYAENNPYTTLDLSQDGKGYINFDHDRVLFYYNHLKDPSIRF